MLRNIFLYTYFPSVWTKDHSWWGVCYGLWSIFNWIIFLLLSFEVFKYSEYKSFADMWFASIFSWSIICLFILLIVSSQANYLIWFSPIHQLLLFNHDFGVMWKNFLPIASSQRFSVFASKNCIGLYFTFGCVVLFKFIYV